MPDENDENVDARQADFPIAPAPSMAAAASQEQSFMSPPVRRMVLAVVLIVTFIVYIGSLQFGFVYDDVEQIVSNPRIQSWHNLPGYFAESVWGKQEQSDYYRPVFLLWLLLNHTFFGLDPSGWHLGLVLLHLLATFLAYLLARRLLRSDAGGLAAALLFGVHPAHVESVAWASGAPDPLMAVFFFGSYISFLICRDQRGRARARWLLFSVVLFLLAALSKEPGLMLVLLLYFHAFLFPPADRDQSPHIGLIARTINALKETGPFLLAAAMYVFVRVEVLRTVAEQKLDLSFAIMARTWPWLLGFYLKKLFWAAPLSAFYDAPYVRTWSVEQFWIPLAAVAVFALVLWAWYRSTRDRIIPLGAAWILAPLLPVFDLLAFNEHDYAHDRYLYLSVFGFSLLVVTALSRLPLARSWSSRMRPEQIRMAAVVLIAAVFAGMTVQQSVYWASELLLYSRGLQIAPETGAKAVNNLVPVLLKRGMAREAIEYSHKLTQKYPDDWSYQYNAGSVHLQLNQLPEAERYFQRAAELIGDKTSRPWLFLGIVRMRQGKFAAAEPALRRALTISPACPDCRYYLAFDLAAQNKTPEAIGILQQLVAEFPAGPRYQELLHKLQSSNRGAGKSIARAPGSAPAQKPKQ